MYTIVIHVKVLVLKYSLQSNFIAFEIIFVGFLGTNLVVYLSKGIEKYEENKMLYSHVVHNLHRIDCYKCELC